MKYKFQHHPPIFYYFGAVLITSSLLGAATSFAEPTAPLAQNLNEGLLLHLECEENAQDSSSKGNHGVPYGNLGYVAGKIGKACSFDGTTSYIDIPNTADFRFKNQSVTYSAWVQIADNAAFYRAFISLQDKSGKADLALAKATSNYERGNIYMVYSQPHGKHVAWVSSLQDGNALPKWKWMLVVGVIDYENNRMRLYIDGSFNNQQTYPSADYNISGANFLHIGAHIDNDLRAYHHHNSLLDDVRIYNRALSEAEINQLYKQGTKATLSVTKIGEGKITSTDNTISCGETCQADYPMDSTVTLTATPATGSTFIGWSDACSGTETCRVSLDSEKTVVAAFGKQQNQPPIVTLISPIKDEPQELDVALKWAAQDPEDGVITSYENAFFKESGKDWANMTCSVVGEDKSTVTCTPPQLEYGKHYIWKVEVKDSGGLSNVVQEWHFTTHANQAPQAPVNLAPQNQLDDVDPNSDVTLTWEMTPDPEGDALTTIIYVNGEKFDRCKSLPNACIISSEDLQYGEKYFWQVAVVDDYNPPQIGEMWTFTTQGNNPPNEPQNPSLKNGDTAIAAPFIDVDQNLPILLSWEGGDPDVGDNPTYTVEIAGCTATSCEKEAAATSCTIPAGTLNSAETCSWLVKAKDEHDNTSTGTVWRFATQANKPPHKASQPVLEQEGKVLDPAVDLIDPKKDLIFRWQLNGDPENDPVTSKVCYADTPEINEEIIPCLSDYATETSATLNKLELEHGTSYSWIVSVQDAPGNKSEWDVWTFKTQAAPATIDLTVNSGYANSLLNWDTHNAELFKITNYRVLRIQGNDPAAFTDDTQYTVVEESTDDSQYKDDTALEIGQYYCYQIDGLDANGNVITSSAFVPEKACVTFGDTILLVKGTSGQKGSPSQSVPIEMPNGGDLKIATGTICLGFDDRVIDYDRVESTAFTGDYNYTPAVIEINGVDGITHFVKITIENNAFDPDEVPTVNKLMGAGSLAEVYFSVKADATADFSPLKLLHNKNAEFDGTSAVDCSNLYVPNNEDTIPLTMRNGTFTVTTRKSLRADSGGIQPRFWVRNAYSRGDLNGNGKVDAADIRIADGIGITKGKVSGYELTSERLIAGDINRDNVINSADADLILEYGFTNTWHTEETPPATRRKPRGSSLRDGNQDNPILLSIDNMADVSGSEVTATLSICNVDNLSALNTTIAYDKNVVEKIYQVRATGLATGASMPYYDNKAGILRIGMHTRTPITGCGAIATMTVRLVTDGHVKTTPLAIAKTNLYDRYGRDFATSVLQRNIDRHNGRVIITDVPEAPVVDDEMVMTPIKDIMPTDNHGATDSASVKVTTQSGTPMAKLTVTVGEQTTTTDTNGYAVVLGLTTGEYSVTVSKEGDILAEDTCVIANNENCHRDFIIDTGESETVEQYACYGNAVDSKNKPLAGVTMQIGDKTIVTDETGYFAFVSLGAGEYAITASKDGGYVFLEAPCVVGNGDNAPLSFVNRNLSLVNQALCQAYMVHDARLNGSQFVTMSLAEHEVSALGSLYRGYDIEAIAIDPKTDIIYVASGNDVRKRDKGHLYILDGKTAELFPVGSTGFNEIGDLVFSSNGTLWAWAKNQGLITIDLINGMGTLKAASKLPVEGLTLFEKETGGLVFYGALNTKLVVYDTDTEKLDTVCTNLPGETEAIQWVSPDLLLMGIHGETALWTFNPQTCQEVGAIPTEGYDDIEGISWPVAACAK